MSRRVATGAAAAAQGIRGVHDDLRQFLLAVGQEKIATSNVDLGSAGTGFASGEKVKS